MQKHDSACGKAAWRQHAGHGSLVHVLYSRSRNGVFAVIPLQQTRSSQGDSPVTSCVTWQVRDRSHEAILSLCCPYCECPLTLHQPDAELPERLLATCDNCKSWYVTDAQGIKLIPVSDLADEIALE
jgi:uncharacterized protein YbaR (Trm112 family)